MVFQQEHFSIALLEVLPTQPSQAQVGMTSKVSVKEIDYVAGIAGTEAQHEDKHPARSIISVPTGIDMELFIKEFMENR